jgi:hypothetical protein
LYVWPTIASQRGNWRFDVEALPLTGLYASNPLAALAAFGLLRAVSEVDGFTGAKLAWYETDDWQAILFVPRTILRQRLAEALAQRQEELDMSSISWSDDIRIDALDFRERLRQCAVSASVTDRDLADRFTAYGSELATDGAKGLVKPTAFHMTSGQQRFLKGLMELAQGLRRNTRGAFEEALFGPWRYQDEQHSMGWDPNTERMAALRHIAPTKEKAKSVRAAVWLAAEALPLFPTAAVESPRGVRLETTGFSRQRSEWRFRWPVWIQPVGLDTLRSLLSDPAIHAAALDTQSLQQRGIVAVYQSAQYRFGQGYGIFRPATPVYRVR